MFIVKNYAGSSFYLHDDYLDLEIQSGESVDLESIFSHEQLYYSSLPPGALWLAITGGQVIRRNDSDTLDISASLAFYDPVWRYSPNQGQWEALVGTVPIPSSHNRYVTELDFGVGSFVETTDDNAKTLYMITVPTNSVMLLQSWVTAARISGIGGNVGDAGTFIKIGTVKNIGDTLTLKIVESAYTFRDQPNWNVFFDVSGTLVRVRVKGSLTQMVHWAGKTRHQVQIF